MKTLLILGNDKISQLAASKISPKINLKILIDRSNNIKRIYKLLTKGVINPLLFIKMFYCEFKRKNFHSLKSFETIHDNKMLVSFVEKHNIKKIILFRAGLIIGKTLIKKKIIILNIHAAKVPKYGGIGSIQKALKQKELNQYASLHLVKVAIDKGKVLDKEKYNLISNKSYCYNEGIAYRAASKLLLRTLLK